MRTVLVAGVALLALLLGGPARASSSAAQSAPRDPLPGAVETQAFGCTTFELEPVDASCPSGHFHSGLDLAGVLAGTPVLAAWSGVAHVVNSSEGYGLHVLLEHSPRLFTLYAHLSSASVADGALVPAGAEVGRVGSSGFSTGPHLHFEVRRDGRPVDPRTLLPAPKPEGGLPW